MLVKCKVCGEKIERDIAYKRVVNGKNFYYHSQKEYEAEEAKKKKVAEDKDKVYRLICDILGEEEILNTALWKEKTIWNKAFSDEIIAKYLAENKDYLTSAVSKLSGTEYAKIRYVSAVLKNSLRDFKPKAEEQPKPKIVVEETIYTTPTHSLNKRRSLADLEDDV